MLCLSVSVSLPLFVQAATIRLQWGIACARTFCAVFSGFSAWGTADEILFFFTKSTLLVFLPLLLLYCFYYGIFHEQVPHGNINEPRQGTLQ